MTDEEIKIAALELTIESIKLFSAAFKGNDVDAVINEAEKVFKFIKGN
jgi:hypothetical protein